MINEIYSAVHGLQSNTYKSTLLENTLVRKWIYLAIFALAMSGIDAIVLVISRLPINIVFLNSLPFKNLLISHVNLSVLIWFLSVTVAIWSSLIPKALVGLIEQLFIFAIIGVILICTAPFIASADKAVLNNYIPMITNLPFVVGLSIYLTVIFIIACIVFLLFIFNRLNRDHNLDLIVGCHAFIVVMRAIFFSMSYSSLKDLILRYPVDQYYFYEILFWGPGHILQFVYTQTATIICILLVQRQIGQSLRFSYVYNFTAVLNCVLIVPAIVIYWIAHLDDPLYTEFFTLHMKYCGGIAILISTFFLIIEYIDKKYSINLYLNNLVLLCFIILFSFGGAIGFMISGTNVIIPAHYHGSIVAITILSMGLIYNILDVDHCGKTPRWQIICYTLGQIIHITGLALSGSHGVMRKTPGLEYARGAKFTMMITGIGGGLAILSGLIFVVICVNKILNNTNHKIKE